MGKIINLNNRETNRKVDNTNQKNDSAMPAMLAYEKELITGKKADEFTSRKGKKELEEWSSGLLDRLGKL